jgi:branched-chain amino acid aminotransferase
VYEVERTFNGKCFRLDEHIDRLYRSLKFARIDPGLSPAEMKSIVEETIRRNEPLRAPVGDFLVSQFVTRGHGRNAWSTGPASVCVKVYPIDWGWYAYLYDTGVHAVIARTRSFTPDSLDPKIKTYNRMSFSLAELEANDVDPGAWPIMLDDRGNVTEGAGYNVLIVTKGVIRSPTDRSILQGVSRGMVFDLAKQLDIPVSLEDMQPYDVYTADEVFFTSTSPCVISVTRVDKRVIGDGKPGPMVKRLQAAWGEAVGMDILGQAARFAHMR